MRKTKVLVALTLLFLAVVPVVVLPAYAIVDGKEVTYSDGEVELKGYISLPPKRFATTKLPAVLIVHEWWGHDRYVRKRADMIAEQLNYVAFALDMYGEGKQASHPEDAGKFSREVSSTEGLREKRFRAAISYLSTREDVDINRIAAIGYCFGGSTVLDMARVGVPLAGVVSFHGSLQTRVETQKITTPILVFHGEDDSFVTKEQIDAFKKEMRTAEAPLEFIVFKGAKHSFTNPQADEYAEKFGINVGYNKLADEASWKQGTAFLKEVLFKETGVRKFKRTPYDEKFLKPK